MSRFKIEANGGHKTIVIQGQKGQQISEREYYAISNGQIPGLLRAELVRKGNAFKLNYDISGFISLREFLVNPLKKDSFAKLLSNILSNLKTLQNAYYNHQFILLDVDAAMVNPTTQQVSFVYVPITFYDCGMSLKDFLLGIIQCCSFAPGENPDYVREYIRILNSGINFSVFDLEEYIKSLKISDQTNTRIRKCSHCGYVLQPNINFCPSCGMKIPAFGCDNHQGIYNPAKNVVPTNKADEGQNLGSIDTVPNGLETISNSCLTNMPQNQQVRLEAQQHKAYICRVKTGEQVRITSYSFRVGKNQYGCEYCVKDNSAISRCHALIKQKSGRWFISDMNSTNKTYVNGKMIQPNTNVEIYNGTNIRLANEDFIFILN